MTQVDLNAFLSDQADDGVKDSEGDFTISHTNARRKLAKFALPRKHAWVSKLVQAAVAWDVRNLHMAQNKTETQFFLEPKSAGALPTENEIVNTILSGKVVAETRAQIESGNKHIREKLGKIPDATKVLTEKQYDDQMSFVLKH